MHTKPAFLYQYFALLGAVFAACPLVRAQTAAENSSPNNDVSDLSPFKVKGNPSGDHVLLLINQKKPASQW
jgi:hypothetical protein